MHCDHPSSPQARRSRKLGRIAIWNRERIVIVIAMGIWVTDIALIIDGKHLIEIMGEFL
jgi:hypothetical protein